MKTQEQLNKEMPARVLTASCAVIALIHFYNSSGKADLVLVGLIALCAAPWMGTIFESISKDGWKYRNQEGEASAPVSSEVVAPPAASIQSATSTPPLPPAAPPASRAQEVGTGIVQTPLSYAEKKVMATLWKYQKIHFPEERQRRWTFTVAQRSPEYLAFSIGVIELVKRGFVALAPTGQVMLSNEGFDFCEQNDPRISSWTETYDDFSGS